MKGLIQIAAFIIMEAAILTACTLWVARNIRVKKSWLFWYLEDEIDRRSDPISYWFFAGVIVVMLASIPMAIIFGVMFGF